VARAEPGLLIGEAETSKMRLRMGLCVLARRQRRQVSSKTVSVSGILQMSANSMNTQLPCQRMGITSILGAYSCNITSIWALRSAG